MVGGFSAWITADARGIVGPVFGVGQGPISFSLNGISFYYDGKTTCTRPVGTPVPPTGGDELPPPPDDGGWTWLAASLGALGLVTLTTSLVAYRHTQ